MGERPTPAGAPEATFEPGEGGGYFETGRPRLGGLQHPATFTEQQTAVLQAVADTMIPPTQGWPTASHLDLVSFIGRYITPSGYYNKHFPFATEDEFKAGLARLGEEFVAADTDRRSRTIAALEETGDPLFEQLRGLIYYGYYSRPEVTLAIRENLSAGRDYHGPPLPYGYLETTEAWDEQTLATAGGTASYRATEDVCRVDLSQLTWPSAKGQKGS